jgi:hypothetical protein
MELEEFENFLDENGIDYKHSGQSIVMKECPECGSKSWKVHFFRERDDNFKPFFGKCFSGKCEKKFSSFSYLISFGIDKSIVYKLHGKDPEVNLKNMLPSIIINEKPKKVVLEPDIEVNISKFFKISDWPDHPASKYAMKRKLPEDLYSKVYINPDNNSVVFLCYKDGKVVGYQERYIMPINPNMKAKTSYGFKVSEYIMEFANSGDIAVCEGPFTATSAYSLGYYAICTFGSNISENKLKKIANLAKKLNKKVGIAIENKIENGKLCNDDANLKAYNKIKNFMFWEKIETFKIYPEDKDLNDALINNKRILQLDSENNFNPAIPMFRGLL